jgi:RHS repeat-associated protein
MLVNASGTVTDSYHLDAWGQQLASTGSTPNPYRYGGAWGYITDPSGMLQLGARFYWPEVGRFVGRDPAKDGTNWYAYVRNQPTVGIDPSGETWYKPWTWWRKPPAPECPRGPGDCLDRWYPGLSGWLGLPSGGANGDGGIQCPDLSLAAQVAYCTMEAECQCGPLNSAPPLTNSVYGACLVAVFAACMID